MITFHQQREARTGEHQQGTSGALPGAQLQPEHSTCRSNVSLGNGFFIIIQIFLLFLLLSLLSATLVTRYHLKDTNITGQMPAATTELKGSKSNSNANRASSQAVCMEFSNLFIHQEACVCRDIFLFWYSAVTPLGIFSLQACTSVAGSKSLLHKLVDFSPNAGTQLICLNAPFFLQVHSFLVLTLLPS